MEEVQAAMTFLEGEPYGFHRFLDKFRILDRIKWNEDLIDGSIRAICQELESELVDYCWLDFSINKYMEPMNWHKKEAIQFIYNAFEKYRPGQVGLILSLKYESTRASQRQYADLIEDPDVADCVVGIDLVGDEAYFDAEFYKPLFAKWNDAGKMTRAHVAESEQALNGSLAITELGVTNIAHGLKMVNHPEMLAQALEYDITFDLGISSNYLTGVWDSPNSHPIQRMLDAGLKVTLGTDDPVQCQTNMTQELKWLQQFRISDEQRQQMVKIANDNRKRFSLD